MTQHNPYQHATGSAEEPVQADPDRATHTSRQRRGWQVSGADDDDTAEWEVEADRALRQAEDDEYR